MSYSTYEYRGTEIEIENRGLVCVAPKKLVYQAFFRASCSTCGRVAAVACEVDNDYVKARCAAGENVAGVLWDEVKPFIEAVHDLVRSCAHIGWN